MQHINISARFRPLTAAIIASVTLHALWISLVRIDYGDDQAARKVKFARVSFVGPAATRGAINLNVKSGENNVFEERYSDMFDRKTDVSISNKDMRASRDAPYGRNLSGNVAMIKMAVEALSQEKEMPRSEAE